MSYATLILGQSGTGKSTSLRNLDPNKVLLIQAISKPLPFRSADWKPIGKDSGTVFVCDNASTIVKAMERTDREIIIIDDFQYIMSNDFMKDITKDLKGNSVFQRFNEIAYNAWSIFDKATKLASHKRIYILAHTQENEYGDTRIKTIGKLCDEKIVLEGMVTTVLQTTVINQQYKFLTQNNGKNTVKSPMGMFTEEHIDNDLAFVDKTICDYYGISTTE